MKLFDNFRRDPDGQYGVWNLRVVLAWNGTLNAAVDYALRSSDERLVRRVTAMKELNERIKNT